MVIRKGERTKKQIERDLPYFGEIEIPKFGLGQKLNALHDWCREHHGSSGYATTSRRDGSKDFVRFHFERHTSAIALARHCGVSMRPLQTELGFSPGESSCF